MKKFIAAFLLLISVASAQSVVGTEHNRNLRTLDYLPMLMDYHRQTVGESRQFFTYPRRNADFVRNFAKTERNALIYYADSIPAATGTPHHFALAVSPVIGVDYRGGESLGDTIWPGIDGGLYLRGYADSLDFDLDARIYSEGHSAKKAKSFDGEVFDEQGLDTDAGNDYVSYARYRAHLNLNYAWVRASLARDVLHWGPGYYNNLTLNQFALPYNMLNLEMQFGPLRVFSAYADLRVNSWSYSKENLNDRNLYAHRYELALGNLTLGMSEIQVLYNENKPWLFVPVIPLFMEKGNYTERVNNGALAFDVNYRLFSLVRLYGEFFLDDMSSPTSLYENKYSNNRWAGMLGMQAGYDLNVKGKPLHLGTIAEIARVEPYTYCHYDTAMAQMAHLGKPLGNPNGPNSLAIDWTLYGDLGLGGFSNLFVGIHHKWLWKGTDAGSDIEDPYKTVRKRFIHSAPLHYSLAPAVSYRGAHVAFMGEYGFFDDKFVNLRLTFML
ncbi:hypothetical protein SAMN05720487_10553 [Fibrobacter sp. UWT2]|uniref:hypothetical protein n=1 Tax=Fibrobacter sp. UWT2 TaxID=1896224 RepID=UPI000911ED33|nr:hypothetical protein [Fibrobacter sp. UWT2]SHK84411.1 hypothetical protein SAMN05720487_10553 [Fibrobacter sp. UWT2]